jgi:hypothetical protein
MGLCQCRAVSSIFCFEHKRNICEKCLVNASNEHRGCYVRPYLQWLSDEAFIEGCRGCGKTTSGTIGEIIRLGCYDIYHFDCLVKLLSNSNPKNKPHFELKCPQCKVVYQIKTSL